MIKFNFKKIKIAAGFTILEALVATSILMVAVAAPITITQKGLTSTIQARNQMVAAYLAQDAIEYIKNKRDEIAIRHSLNSTDYSFDWEKLYVFGNYTTKTMCMSNNGCQIDTTIPDADSNTPGASSTILPGGVNPTNVKDYISNNHLWKNNSTGFYGYTSVPAAEYTETSFVRQVQIKLDPYGTSPDNPYEALVRVTVSWGTNAVDKVVVNTLIYNM